MLIEDARELLERPMRLLEQMRAGSLWETESRELLEIHAAPAPLPMISVIIPAHNEEGYLGRTLDALARQNYSCFEVIVVANGCTDTTPMEAVGKCNRLVVISQKSLGVARNLGARLARGEILLFLDADTLLEPAALRSVAAEFRKCFAAAVTSMRRYVRQGCLRMLWLWSRVWLQSIFGDLHSRPYETVR